MKVKFSSEKGKVEFSSISRANKVIADFMGMRVYNAVNHDNGDIELIDRNGRSFEIDGGWSGGWYPIIYMPERRFFDIEV